MVAPGRRSLVVAAALLVLVAGLCSVVPPRRGSAVVTVSRLGARVRLLPPSVSLSFLPLARRLAVPVRDGHAVIETELEGAATGGGRVAVPVRIELAGSGRLPIDAAEARYLGLAEAWRVWLAERLQLTDGQLRAVVATSSRWREIFPSAAPRPLPAAVADSVAAALSPLTVARVEVGDLDSEYVRAVARQELAHESAPHGRLVVLGLDALDWRLLDDLTARGVMPNVHDLVGRGAQAINDVPPPLISPVVWNTIATGEPPEVHGVLDFLETDPAGGAPRPVTAASRKAPGLWELAAAAGRSTATIGWWATFPAAAPAGGEVYSDRLTEQLLGLTRTTPGLADPPIAQQRARELALRAQDVTVRMLAPIATVGAAELEAAKSSGDAWDEPVGGLVKLMAATRTVENLADDEIGRGTQIVLAYLEGTDIVGHLFGRFRPPASRDTDPVLARRFGPVVDRYHRLVDAWIGRVVARLGPEDTLVIVSDHGFAWGEDRPHVPSGTHTATATMWHRPEGVFIAAGPGVRASSTRHRLGVLDVAPSLLAIAGLPPSAEMPGHVPDWLLGPAAARAAPVRYAALLAARRPSSTELSPEARQEALAKLRALGYVAGPGAAAPTTHPTAGTINPSVPAAAAPAFDRAEARRLNNLAISQASAGERERAEASFKKAIAADPTYAPTYYSFSTMLRRELRLEQADQMFWMAVRLGVQESELAVVRLALDYQARDMPAKGREVLAEGRRLFPDSATIWLNSGVFLGDHGDLGGAVACLRRAVQLAPDNAAAHRNLAVALLGVGDKQEARRALLRVLELEPTDASARQQLEALGPSGP